MNKGLNKDDIIKVKQLIDSLEADPKCYIFLEPVDVEGLGLTDYLDIVKHPMDMSTIKKKLKLNNYMTIQDVMSDLQLVWSNCKLYNQEGSEIYLLAVSMEKACKKLYEKIFKEAPKPEKEKEKKKLTKNESAISHINDKVEESHISER